MTVPALTLNDNNTIPQLGFGVFKVEPGETARIVLDAFEVGYRHIDTAAGYANEAGVGEAFAKSGLARDDVFITTKLANPDHGTQSAFDALDKSLDLLGLEYVDLYLIHWPQPKRGLFVETWLALEQLKAQGKARSIGVSNFLPEHLVTLADASSVVPTVNQVELHPIFQQVDTRAYGDAHGIRTEAWAPLGQGRYALEDQPAIVALAAKYGKSVQQVTLRWHIQLGTIVIPKSNRRERMLENISIFDFELSADDMASIAAIDTNERVAADPNEIN